MGSPLTLWVPDQQLIFSRFFILTCIFIYLFGDMSWLLNALSRKKVCIIIIMQKSWMDRARPPKKWVKRSQSSQVRQLLPSILLSSSSSRQTLLLSWRDANLKVTPSWSDQPFQLSHRCMGDAEIARLKNKYTLHSNWFYLCLLILSLQVLDLGFNLLRVLPVDAFHGSKLLTLLALDGNPMATLDESAFNHLSNSLRGLSLGSKFLTCDCKLKWVAEWIQVGWSNLTDDVTPHVHSLHLVVAEIWSSSDVTWAQPAVLWPPTTTQKQKLLPTEC